MTTSLRIVLICGNGAFGKPVLRSLATLGARAHLVCDRRSAYLRFSIACDGVLLTSENLPEESREKIVAAIERLHRERAVDLVVAAEVASMRILAEIKDRLPCAAFPTADSVTLARLHHKWSFYELCRACDAPTPRTIYFPRKELATADEIERTLGFPVIAKPLGEHGASGVTYVAGPDEFAAKVRDNRMLRSPDLLVQEYIAGPDLGLSVFARSGEIEHWAMFLCCDDGVIEFIDRPDFLDAVRRLMTLTGFTGVANFDARLDTRCDAVKLLECNPRFFGRMKATRLCGLDFLQAGLAAHGLHAPPMTSLGNGRYHPLRQFLPPSGWRRVARGEWPFSSFRDGVREFISDPIPGLAYAWDELLVKRAPLRFIRPPD